MNQKEILSHVDHTLLGVDSTWNDIKGIIDDGIHYETASVCIPPRFVKQAAEYADGKVKICTVIGFPNGYSTTATKLFECRDALDNGADEIDTVINIGFLKSGRYDEILSELTELKKICGDKILKVIIETCLLTDEEKVKLCEIVSKSGADYIKTSTGFSTGGVTREDVALFAANITPELKIKAAGGISSFDDGEKFISLGADRLGTSRLIKIMKNTDSGAGY